MQNDTRLSLGYKSYFTERYQLESVSFFKKKKIQHKYTNIQI